jgi:hypothetical protein
LTARKGPILIGVVLAVTLGVGLPIAAPRGSLAQEATPPGDQPTEGQPPPGRDLNPCLGEHASRLRCPDLIMGKPADMFASRTPGGRTLLHATNNLKSRGRGPAILRGRRTGRSEMAARQHIYRVDGSRRVVRTGAELYFYFIPGQGHYWKFHHAARFELWSLDSGGHRNRLVRTGPKLNYCLRDLKRTRPSPRSPRARVFHGCSQDSTKKAVTLGTSVGWSDIYPSTYHEQYIDVTGLRGCFAYLHRADPDNGIYESNESNNATQRIVRLPWGSRKKC